MHRMLRRAAVLTLSAAALSMSTMTVRAGEASLLVDVHTGQALDAENADALNHPASLTKMMTLYMTFEALKEGRLAWTDRIVLSENAESKIPFKFAIGAGKTVTVREAVEGMIVLSANDAAVAVAEHLGGSEAGFAVMMTERARRLGMSRTVFRNPTGLPDPDQVTSARDMAVLAVALMRDYPQEFTLFSMRGMKFRGMKLRGHNNLMYRYQGVDGIKTGYTDASGYNLVTSAQKDGRRVVGVVMGGKTAAMRDEKMAGLLNSYLPLASQGGESLFATSTESLRPTTAQ